ncbi:diguanylate cyclase [Candidatus Fermentibacteria bacterium]|nr:MAG: diguanylate cyclase [Candidatus Fermentibacteria bacterium]
MAKTLTTNDIRDLYILRRVSPDLAIKELSNCFVRKLGRNEVLLSAGQSNRKLYIILSGTFTVHLDSPKSDPVAILDSGETVGELSVIDDSPASAFVVSTCESRVLEVDEKSFWNLINSSSEFAGNMLHLLAYRMRSSDNTITENIRMRRRFENDAMVDVLTGMKNRRWLDKQLSRLIVRNIRSQVPLSVIMFDVDHFKKFNDTYGHAAGDDALSSVATMAVKNLKPADLVARYGGEEFVIVLSGANAEQAYSAAERVRKAVGGSKVVTRDGRVLPPVTISLGAVQAEPGEDADSVLRKADDAMYRAKSFGRNCTCG